MLDTDFCQFLWIITWLILAAAMELALGNAGLSAPVLLMLVFYLTVVFRWQPVWLPASVCAVCVDIVWSRPLPATAFAVFFAMLFGMLWRHQGSCSHGAVQVAPGIVLALIHALFTFFLVNLPVEPFSLGFLWRGILQVVETVLLTALCMPLFCWMLDWGAGKLNLAEYQHAGAKEVLL